MDPTRTRQAARILLDSRRAARWIDALPEACRPADRLEGYAVQAELAALHAGEQFGWKIAATSAAGQAHIGVDGPLAGRMMMDDRYDSGAAVSIAANRMRVAELEFAFRIGRTLPPRDAPYAVPEVLDAVAALHPAIELPDSRYDDFVTAGAAQLIADNACAHHFVLGEASRADWRTLDLRAHEVRGGLVGRPVQHGRGENVLGDPRVALAWLANELSSLGIALRAGQVVTTGTCVVPIAVSPGDRVEGDFGVLGRVAVELAA